MIPIRPGSRPAASRRRFDPSPWLVFRSPIVPINFFARVCRRPAGLRAAAWRARRRAFSASPPAGGRCRSFRAQTRCYRLIHHDTFAYEGCLDGMLADLRKPGPRRLGIEYFGFVGASTRPRLRHARLKHRPELPPALSFHPRKNSALTMRPCAPAIPGDCEARIARIRLIEKSPRPAPAAGNGRRRRARPLTAWRGYPRGFANR